MRSQAANETYTCTKEDMDFFKIWLTYLLLRKYKVLAQRTAMVSRYLVA